MRMAGRQAWGQCAGRTPRCWGCRIGPRPPTEWKGPRSAGSQEPPRASLAARREDNAPLKRKTPGARARRVSRETSASLRARRSNLHLCHILICGRRAIPSGGFPQSADRIRLQRNRIRFHRPIPSARASAFSPIRRLPKSDSVSPKTGVSSRHTDHVALRTARPCTRHTSTSAS